MKFILALVLISFAGVAGWMFYPNIHKNLEAKRVAALQSAQAKEALSGIKVPVEPKPEKAATSKAAELLSSFKGKTAGSDSGKSMGGNQEMNADSPPEKDSAAPGDAIEERYPLPEFRSIEEITKEWTSIPARAFPRMVRTRVSVNFEGPSGKTVMKENSSVLAVGMVQGMLILMRDKTDSARSMTPLANTDLKDSLSGLYEKYKDYKTSQVMKQRERARSLLAGTDGVTPAQITAAGPKPTAAAGGVIPAMLQSLEAREISETTADKITAWGDLNVEQINGESWWTGTVQCTVDNPIFGPVPTELMALIRNGKVMKWLYSGSKEPVQ